jgi:hypothetical protein
VQLLERKLNKDKDIKLVNTAYDMLSLLRHLQLLNQFHSTIETRGNIHRVDHTNELSGDVKYDTIAISKGLVVDLLWVYLVSNGIQLAN